MLGGAPVLTWAEYTPEPWKLYAKVTLASTDQASSANRVSFLIDRGLMKVLRAGDQLHVAALPTVGMTIVHDDFLVAAAGPVDVLRHMPLSSEFRICAPTDDLEERFFKQPEAFHYFLGGRPPRGKPFVEIVAAGETRIMPWGRPDIGPFEVFVRASTRPGALLMSIERLKVCPETAAHTSAQLLDREPYQVVGGSGIR